MVAKYEEISNLLREIVQKIKTEEDPVSLNEIRKIFRKEIPFFLRSYTAAFLLKQMTSGSNRPFVSRNNRDTYAPRAPSFRPVFDDAISSTIFISIGRNRRVFPRDLIALVSQIAGIDRDRIGEIRVLDNYSFVQLLKEDADHVIQSLNEYEYRGRRLAVSYSRKKEDMTFVASSEDFIESNEDFSDDQIVSIDDESAEREESPVLV